MVYKNSAVLFIFLYCYAMRMHGFTVVLASAQAGNPAERNVIGIAESVMALRLQDEVKKHLEKYGNIKNTVLHTIKHMYDAQKPYEYASYINQKNGDVCCVLHVYPARMHALHINVYTLPAVQLEQVYDMPHAPSMYRYAHARHSAAITRMAQHFTSVFLHNNDKGLQVDYVQLNHRSLYGITYPACVIECGVYDHYSIGMYGKLIADALYTIMQQGAL